MFLNHSWCLRNKNKPGLRCFSLVFSRIWSLHDNFIDDFGFFNADAPENSYFEVDLGWKHHGYQNRVCRFVCMRRTDMKQSALDSPDPGECFEYPYHGSATHRKLSTLLWSLSARNFLSSVDHGREISEVEKNWKFSFLMPKMIFLKNVF